MHFLCHAPDKHLPFKPEDKADEPRGCGDGMLGITDYVVKMSPYQRNNAMSSREIYIFMHVFT